MHRRHPTSTYLVFPLFTAKSISFKNLITHLYLFILLWYRLLSLHYPQKPVPDGCHSWPNVLKIHWLSQVWTYYFFSFEKTLLPQEQSLLLQLFSPFSGLDSLLAFSLSTCILLYLWSTRFLWYIPPQCPFGWEVRTTFIIICSYCIESRSGSAQMEDLASRHGYFYR